MTMTPLKISTAMLGGLALAACQAPATDDGDPPVTPAPSSEQRAQRLATETLIVDTHVDVPYRLGEEMADISQRTDGGDFDYPRAVAGGLDAPFMSIYVPASYQEGGAFDFAESLIDLVEGFERQWPDKFRVATSVDEVVANFEAGVMSLPMGMENGAPIEGDLAKLRHFHDRGIRYVTLTHGENNHICDSSYARERTWNGLSPFGREVVAEMNRLGMMIDVSHVSDEAFWQVMELTEAPVIASHSSLRHFTPGFERNLSDEMVVALGDNGGTVQINFGSAFLTAAANAHSREYYGARGAYAAENGLEDGDPELEAWSEAYLEEHPPVFADVSDVVAHIDRVVELAGIDHVGLGSDFDGVGDSLPTGLKDASQLPNLIAALLDAGYSEADVEKILSGNVLRVWREVERVAAASGAG